MRKKRISVASRKQRTAKNKDDERFCESINNDYLILAFYRGAREKTMKNNIITNTNKYTIKNERKREEVGHQVYVEGKGKLI
jgi:hypothetical protein